MSRRGLRAGLAGAGAVLVTAALLSAGPAAGQPPSGPVVAGPIPGSPRRLPARVRGGEWHLGAGGRLSARRAGALRGTVPDRVLPLVALLTRRWLLVLSMGSAAAALTLLPFTTSVPVLFGIMVVAGFGLGVGQPVTLAWVAARAPRDVRGTAVGVRLSGNRLGQTVIPAVVGGLAGALGLGALFLSPAVLLALGGSLVVRARFDEAQPGSGATADWP